MNMNQGMTVIETIKEKYNNIFLAEKKVADFILENPEKAVNCNVSELANYSGVSDATVIRLCKHIGYQGYYQLRINLSRDLGRKSVSDNEMENIKVDTVSGLFQAFSYSITAIGKNLEQSKLLDCANLIKKSKHVHIVAVGNTSPLAMYMGFRLGRFGVKCTYNMIPEYFLNHINLADEDDIVIAISQSGDSKHVVQAMELAKEKGLKIIAITAFEYSPVSRLADYLLLSNVSGQPFDYYKSYCHLNETVVIDALLHFVANEERIIASSADKPEMILSEYKL
ncbi:MurR/RpiR family transcriptional regulator [Clostridium sediminicola]|uniref:MurR/RpiR family transcriptional regulator n=1 Tax=Clostridium sediminicola TaxID=3114879 RepID=UPI0031F1CEB1